MISEPLQLDILTIEQQHRRNTEQQENKCFSGAGSGSRYRDHSREEQENRNRIRRNQISRRGRGAAGDRGAFNLEGACYFRYCLNVVCFYTDLKMKILKMKAESVQKPKGGH